MEPQFEVYSKFDDSILSDTQWNRLTAKFPLPIKARPEIATAIRAYQAGKTNAELARLPSERKKTFDRAAAHAAALAAELSTFGFEDWCDLSEVDDAFDRDAEVVSKKLDRLQANCLSLQRWLVEARTKIRSGKTNRSPQPLRDFMELVDVILIECNGSGLKTSNGREKQFMVDLCTVADKSIGSGSINEAIAFTIANRSRRVFHKI